MRLIDLDKFLEDLRNECCDVCDADERCPAYSEFGYSFELIERVAERQVIIKDEPVKDNSFDKLMDETNLDFKK